jgi:hypothetical protein
VSPVRAASCLIGAVVLAVGSSCSTPSRPVSPAAAVIAGPVARVHGTIVWVAPAAGEAVVDLYGPAPEVGVRLAVRDEALALAAIVVVTGPMRGRMLGVRVVEGRPQLGHEVADLPTVRETGRGR